MSILQIKNVPEELHAKLAARAKDEHTTMSAIVISLLDRELNEHPTSVWLRQLRETHRGMPLLPKGSGARAVAEARREREQHWDERLDERRR